MPEERLCWIPEVFAYLHASLAARSIKSWSITTALRLQPRLVVVAGTLFPGLGTGVFTLTFLLTSFGTEFFLATFET
jgi:hypothetical protein